MQPGYRGGFEGIRGAQATLGARLLICIHLKIMHASWTEVTIPCLVLHFGISPINKHRNERTHRHGEDCC